MAHIHSKFVCISLFLFLCYAIEEQIQIDSKINLFKMYLLRKYFQQKLSFSIYQHGCGAIDETAPLLTSENGENSVESSCYLNEPCNARSGLVGASMRTPNEKLKKKKLLFDQYF